ncbi:MAG TPA: phosphatase PAP2 family protein, partial [Methylomirabilota bacterium]|nr:phosphatase PAP2 family protein [Methylomirabilota bacterium]
ATFAVLVVYLVGRSRLARPWRLGIQGLALLTMMAVGLARILLGAHWPSDVLAGLALGAAGAAAAVWWHLTHPSPETIPSTEDLVMKRRLFGIALVALLLAACSREPRPGGKPLVVATFSPLYEFSRQVAVTGPTWSLWSRRPLSLDRPGDPAEPPGGGLQPSVSE